MAEMINTVNKALIAYFADHITVSESEIGFQKPKKDWVDGTATASIPKMSIYLFDIRENLELRSNEWQPENHDTSIKQKKPDARIDLFYMITFYSTQESTEAKNLEKEHRWISETLSVIYNNAYIPKEYFYDDVSGEILSGIPKIPAIPIRPKFLGEDGGLQIWSALDQYLMPVIYLKVTIPISLAKYLEDAQVLTKIFKFGIPDQKNYYILNIQPPVDSLVCSDSQHCLLSKIEITSNLNYLDEDAEANTNQIILINRENIHTNDYIVLRDGGHSELCLVTNVDNHDNRSNFTLQSALKYTHTKGREIQSAKVETPEELIDIHLLEDVRSGSSQFKLIGEDIGKIKNGDLVSLKNNSGTAEYFFITAKFKENIEIKEILEVDSLNT